MYAASLPMTHKNNNITAILLRNGRHIGCYDALFSRRLDLAWIKRRDFDSRLKTCANEILLARTLNFKMDKTMDISQSLVGTKAWTYTLACVACPLYTVYIGRATHASVLRSGLCFGAQKLLYTVYMGRVTHASDCGTALISGCTKLKSNSLNTQKSSKMKGMVILTLFSC